MDERTTDGQTDRRRGAPHNKHACKQFGTEAVLVWSGAGAL